MRVVSRCGPLLTPEVDDSDAASLPAPGAGPPHFSKASRTLNERPRVRAAGEHGLEVPVVFILQEHSNPCRERPRFHDDHTEMIRHWRMSNGEPFERPPLM